MQTIRGRDEVEFLSYCEAQFGGGHFDMDDSWIRALRGEKNVDSLTWDDAVYLEADSEGCDFCGRDDCDCSAVLLGLSYQDKFSADQSHCMLYPEAEAEELSKVSVSPMIGEAMEQAHASGLEGLQDLYVHKYQKNGNVSYYFDKVQEDSLCSSRSLMIAFKRQSFLMAEIAPGVVIDGSSRVGVVDTGVGQGYCYINIAVSKDRVKLSSLGFEPTWKMICHFVKENGIEILPVDRLKVDYDYSTHKFHVEEVDDPDLANLIYQPVLCRELGLQYHLEDYMAFGDLADVVGTHKFPARLDEQANGDPETCFCNVHVKPYGPTDSYAEGCAVKQLGNSEVVRSAGLGRNRACHALPSVRRADLLFISGLLGDSRVDMGRLCTSDVNVKLTDFGRGYCYLDPLRKDSYWRVARVAGPNPLLCDYGVILSHVGRLKGKKHKLICVDDGLFHVCVDKEIKGEFDNPWKSLLEQLDSIVRNVPFARIG